jgi:hypothetical protein
VLGYITLAIFLIIIVLTLFKKITLPIQTVLVLISLIIMVVGGAFLFFTEGWKSVLLLPNEMMAGIILHPITALLAGLFLAGALSASGGFEALKVILNWIQKTPLGLAGTLVIITQIPLIASLPCGRIIGAALLPLLFSFGLEGGMGILTKSQLIVFIGAFGRNAFGSCGPSPIGGVGQIGEGFLGSYFPTASLGILRSPQAFALMLGTAMVALFLKMVSMKLYPNDVSLRDLPEGWLGRKKDVKINAPMKGYISLVIFIAALLISIFQPFGKVPVQTVLVLAGILIMAASRGTIQDLMGGIILMPVAAMTAGFMAAGALAATGGFDALGNVLRSLTSVLGVAGTLVVFVNIQTILPLSCSRILTAALVPVLYFFGPAKFNFLSWSQLAIVMSAYIINATTSCGPSPLGGAGMMAEGQMRAESGYIRGAYSFGVIATMTPLAAIFMKFLNLSIFSPDNPEFVRNLWAIGGYAALVVMVNIVIIKVLSGRISADSGRNWVFQGGGFCLAGATCGLVLSISLFELDVVSMIQGILGGVVAAFLVAFLVPKTRTLVKAEATPH